MAIITKVNGFLEVNMDKIAITIFQGSVVTQTVLGESRQSYCNENRVQFFLAHFVYTTFTCSPLCFTTVRLIVIVAC